VQGSINSLALGFKQIIHELQNQPMAVFYAVDLIAIE